MALTLLAGPANAGKVALLLERYLADLDREPILIVPSSGGEVDPGGAPNNARSRWASAGGLTSVRGGSSSIRGCASSARSDAVRSSDANAARPGS